MSWHNRKLLAKDQPTPSKVKKEANDESQTKIKYGDQMSGKQWEDLVSFSFENVVDQSRLPHRIGFLAFVTKELRLALLSRKVTTRAKLFFDVLQMIATFIGLRQT